MLNKEQLKAARAWLGLSQNEVAKISKVAAKTIKNFERDAYTPYERTFAGYPEGARRNGN